MPTYEYECEKCGHCFEAFQSMSAVPLSICPECRGKVRRLVSGGGGVIFKGEGFHATDYPAGGAAPPCGSESRCCGRDESCGSAPCSE
jgi:putative FmdB family regulatory protein